MLVSSLVELGALIRRRRTSLGLSQTELAEQVGSTRQWVSRLEQGKNDISTARLFAVLDVLELNLDLRPPQVARPSHAVDAGTKSIIPADSLIAIARSLERVDLPHRDDMAQSLTVALAGLHSVKLPDRSEMLKNLSAGLQGIQAVSRQLTSGRDTPQQPDAQPKEPDDLP